MKAWKRIGVMALTISGVVSLASGVKADTIDGMQVTDQITVDEVSSYSQLGPGESVDLSLHGAAAADGSTYTGYAGEIGAWTGSVTAGPDKGTSLDFYTFCTQLTTTVTVPGNNYKYTVTSLQNTPDVTSGTQANEIAGVLGYALANASTFDNGNYNAWAAGVQVAIWSILYGSTDVTWTAGPNLSWQSDASTFLSHDSTTYQDVDGISGSQQNQVIWGPGSTTSPPVTPTPKPLSGGVVLFGALGAFASLRRRSSKTPVPVLT